MHRSLTPWRPMLISMLSAALSLLWAVSALAAQPTAGKMVNGSSLKLPGAVSARIAAIRGKLTKPGYTVIALAANGKMTSARAGRGTFALRPPATAVTVQLRAPNGVYGGPIVIAVEKRGKLAITGVRAGANLGAISVNARHGYAKVGRKPPTRWVDVTRWARAKNGVPTGAGRFGLVRSALPRRAPAGDLDADGVPNVLDIDVNGNLIVNNVDRAKVARGLLIAGQAAGETPSNFVKSSLGEWIWETANADAAGFTDGQADTGLSTIGYLVIGIQDGGSVELDCGQPQTRANPTIGGLIYCTEGGTGRVFKGTANAARRRLLGRASPISTTPTVMVSAPSPPTPARREPARRRSSSRTAPRQRRSGPATS